MPRVKTRFVWTQRIIRGKITVLLIQVSSTLERTERMDIRWKWDAKDGVAVLGTGLMALFQVDGNTFSLRKKFIIWVRGGKRYFTIGYNIFGSIQSSPIALEEMDRICLLTSNPVMGVKEN